jgi:formylglycine-generating enzyme required for sulfatase activity
VQAKRSLLALVFLALSHPLGASRYAVAEGAAKAPPSQERGVVVVLGGDDDDANFTYGSSNALVIGVSDYSNGWRSLPGVKEDLPAVKDALEKHHFQVIMPGLNLTQRQIEDAVRDFIADYGQDQKGRVVFYFAGHGHTIPRAGVDRGFYVPVDAPLPEDDSSEAKFVSKAIDLEQFGVWAKQIRSRHVLFVFDSCFSGSIFDVLRSMPQTIKNRIRWPVRQFITSGTANQQVPDQSEFRKFFVEGLSGAADGDGDSYITGTELGEYLTKNVSERRPSQTPVWGKLTDMELSKGDFVFALTEDAQEPKGSTTAQILPTLESASLRDYTLTNGQLMRGSAKTHEFFRESLGEGQEIEMYEIPGGKYEMGSPEGEGEPGERPRHEVGVKRFFISRYEITQAQWSVVASLPKVDMELGKDPSYFKGDIKPVDSVSWEDAVEFCKRLSRHTGRRYRLPSEAQWEYACRARSSTRYHIGDSISPEYFTFGGQHGLTRAGGDQQGTTVVSLKGVYNAFGLHGMHGNVAEWVLDSWHEDYAGAPVDGRAWTDSQSNSQILRGGSWVDNADACRCAARLPAAKVLSRPIYGFRIALEISGE